MDYQTRLTEHFLAFKADHLPGLEDGTWSYRGTPKSYAHILPKEQFQLNILPGIRDRFWRWFKSANPPITQHQYFHHLNSSQALAFNLFFPFLNQTTCRVDSRLLRVLGVPADGPYSGQFEKVFDRDENTNFDFYLEGPAEHKVFIEFKLSENEFGSCVNDERHCQKLERPIGKSIRPRLRRAETVRREPVRARSPRAHNRPYVHAGCPLPSEKPPSARAVSGISAQLPGNVAQR